MSQGTVKVATSMIREMVEQAAGVKDSKGKIEVLDKVVLDSVLLANNSQSLTNTITPDVEAGLPVYEGSLRYKTLEGLFDVFALPYLDKSVEDLQQTTQAMFGSLMGGEDRRRREKVAEMTARAEDAQKAQGVLASVFKISEGKAEKLLEKKMKVATDQVQKDLGESAVVRILQEAGYGLPELLSLGHQPRVLRAVGVSAAALVHHVPLKGLYEAGFPAQELISLGYSKADLKDLGCGADVLRSLGYQAADLRGCSFRATELVEAGWTPEELKDAGFTAKELLTLGARQLRAMGFTVQDLSQAGFQPRELRDGGYHLKDMMMAGHSFPEVLIAGEFPLDQISSTVVHLFTPGGATAETAPKKKL
ncbi:unnamed protein product [Durusdinium trenchii]|uniref:Uncharacterized protein n=1 Tax=Durusdinium trenchii TaxID=1381693 RepID=A0ABP0P2D5_9DINO